MGKILDGKGLADRITQDIKKQIVDERISASLAVVIVGNNPASRIYVRNKAQKANELGIKSQIISLDENISQSQLETEIEKLANDDEIGAILVQLPLPKHINTAAVIEKIPPNKDADGFHPYNLGKLLSGEKPFALPCTPLGIMEILKEYNINLEGKNVVVVGRSNIVGKPLASMMTNANATVTLCHSKTKNLNEITKQADILVVAIGKPKFIKADDIKNGAVVIDVGINRGDDEKIVGDVDFDDVFEKVSCITPVPKGVGPMTIAMLMKNAVELSKN